MKRLIAIALLLPCMPVTCLAADDGAASIAAGGIVTMARETRITMAKEILRISPRTVRVDYDFRNDTNQDVTTEVAFPIPAYDFSVDEVAPAQQGFDDFRLLVNGAPAKFEVQVRALVDGRDVTALLEQAKVGVGNFGHAISLDDVPDLRRLSPIQRRALETAGAIDKSGEPQWKVQKKYHWKQTFPAHAVIHISHIYTPVLGSTNSVRYGLGPSPDPESARELNEFCMDSPLKAKLRQVASSKDLDAPYSFVDFILTSANTWKRPIEDFTLIVERPHSKGSLSEYVSFCWPGRVTKVDADHFQARARNFVPARELKIGFFDVEKVAF